jgi:hypothetical protein
MRRVGIFSGAALVYVISWSGPVWKTSVGTQATPSAQAALVEGMTRLVWGKGRDVPLCFGIAPSVQPHRYLETLVPAARDLRVPSTEVMRILSLHEPDIHPVSECDLIEGASPERMAVRKSGKQAAIVWLRDFSLHTDSTAVGRSGFRAAGMGEFLCEARLRSMRWERAYCIRDWQGS